MLWTKSMKNVVWIAVVLGVLPKLLSVEFWMWTVKEKKQTKNDILPFHSGEKSQMKSNIKPQNAYWIVSRSDIKEYCCSAVSVWYQIYMRAVILKNMMTTGYRA